MTLVATALLGGLYVLIGWVSVGPCQASMTRLSRVALSLVVGFAVTPPLLAWLSLACGGHVDRGAMILVALAVLAAWRLRGRREERRLVYGPRAVAGSLLLLGVVVAVAANSAYLAWMLGWQDATGRVVVGTSVFDFEKHVGMLSALVAYGFPPEHPMAPGVPLLYYLGFYMAPAAVSTLGPATTVEVLVAQFLCAAVVVTCVVGMCTVALRSPRGEWSIATVLVVLSGLSLGAGFQVLPPRPEAATLWSVWHSPLHIEPVAQMLVWVPQHTVAIAYALLVLVRSRDLVHRAGREQIVLGALWGAVWAFSAFIGLFLSVTLATRLGLDVFKRAKNRWRGVACASGTAALCALPFYLAAGAALLTGNLPASSAFGATESVVYNLGTVWATAGVGVVGVLMLPLRAERPFVRRLWSVWTLMVVCLVTALFASRVSEVQFMALYALQLGLPFLACQLLALSTPTQSAAGRVARTGLLYLAALSGAYGLVGVLGTWRYAPRVSVDEGRLVRWLQHQSAPDAIVSTLFLSQTSFDYRIGRVGAASGVGTFSRLEDRWGHVEELRAYRRRNSPNLGGVAQSDYLLVPARSTQYFSDVAGAAGPHAVETLQALGFSVVERNSAGTILRNARLPRATRAASLVEVQGSTVLLEEARRMILGREDVGRARQLLEVVVQAPGPPAEAVYLLAYSLQISGEDLPRARRLYGQALDAGYHEFWVRYNRGALQIALGDRRAACFDLQRARELDATHPGIDVFLSQLGGCADFGR